MRTGPFMIRATNFPPLAIVLSFFLFHYSKISL